MINSEGDLGLRTMQLYPVTDAYFTCLRAQRNVTNEMRAAGIRGSLNS
jgi:hypothetical protein